MDNLKRHDFLTRISMQLYVVIDRLINSNLSLKVICNKPLHIANNSHNVNKCLLFWYKTSRKHYFFRQISFNKTYLLKLKATVSAKPSKSHFRVYKIHQIVLFTFSTFIQSKSQSNVHSYPRKFTSSKIHYVFNLLL